MKKITTATIEQYQLDNTIQWRKLPFEHDEPRPERIDRRQYRPVAANISDPDPEALIYQAVQLNARLAEELNRAHQFSNRQRAARVDGMLTRARRRISRRFNLIDHER